MATIGGPIVQRQTDAYGEWVKLFRHNSIDKDFFSSANSYAEAKQTNTSLPNGNKYSILSSWGKFLKNGKYTLKLNYPNNAITNIWSQTNNPVIEAGAGGVTGYIAISIGASPNGWGGLEYYAAVSSTFLDGTINSGNWYYAVGVRDAWSGVNTFPGPSSAVSLVELWILDKPV
jgi:hypothetical protein